MSVLSDRIRDIVAGAAKPKPLAPESLAPESLAPESLVPESPAIKSQAPNPESLAALGGIWHERCFVVERELKPSARHGREVVAAIAGRLHSSAEDAPLLTGGAPAQPPFVFFDLETTGLSGGAGTHAFLVGCGWFSAESFVTRQFLLTRFADEPALLAIVARELERAGALVSFNGKSFDVPLLETRCLYHRLPWFGARLPHVDVLHPARQFWKRDDCSLAALEHRLLGHRRAGDVSGFEVPGRYFQFVRTGDARPLAVVLEHNRLDLLSLAALTSRLLQITRSGPDAAADAREALALGHLYARSGFESRAREAYVRSVSMSRAPRGAFDAVKIEGLRALALALRRARRFGDAAECWRQLLDIRGCPTVVAREATEALAIHHEHRVRDLAAARAFALQGLDGDEGSLRPAWTQAVRHRLCRLNRKIERETVSATRPQSLSLPLQPSSAAPTSAPRISS